MLEQLPAKFKDQDSLHVVLLTGFETQTIYVQRFTAFQYIRLSLAAY
jgi:hypothetical protein